MTVEWQQLTLQRCNGDKGIANGILFEIEIHYDLMSISFNFFSLHIPRNYLTLFR